MKIPIAPGPEECTHAREIDEAMPKLAEGWAEMEETFSSKINGLLAVLTYADLPTIDLAKMLHQILRAEPTDRRVVALLVFATLALDRLAKLNRELKNV